MLIKRTTCTVKSNKKIKVFVTGNSLLNGISEKGLSRNHQATVKNFPGGTSEKALEKMENIVADKPNTRNLSSSVYYSGKIKKIFWKK